MRNYISESELTTLIKQLNLDELETASNPEGASVTADIPALLPEEQDGWLQIAENRRIIVHDPVGGGDYPSLSSMFPVKLFINGREVTTETKVSSEDLITWEIEDQELFEVTISDDKLFAYFYLFSKERYPWRLVDVPRATRLIVRAEKDKNIVLETVHLGDVVSQLEKMSIKSHVDFAAIQQELLLPTHLPIIAAKGKAPIPGQDARLEIYFSQHVENEFFEVDGAIDFRNHLRIPSVQKGEVLARKIPLVDGIPGYDVLGGVTMPNPPKDVFIIAKSNVELSADGAIIARKQGRPRITGGKIKTFDVSTSYIVPGDVDIETGNIVFSGDVIVYGDVTDNMIIESLGNVYVYGNVYNSTITGTGSINVRGNIIASRLYSGYFGVLFNRLYHTSRILCDYVQKLLSAADVLAHALESKRQTVLYGQIILLLLENKMREIPDAIKELLFVISNIQHIKQEEYVKLKQISEIFSQPTKLLETATHSFVQSFLTLLQDTHKEVARMQEENVEISVNQCHRSELKSNGDIVIHRDGVLICDLFSARNIIFTHENSVCRGSTLEAGDSISAKVIGGQTGANSVLKAKRKVHVERLYSGRVCIGKYCRDIFEVVENMTFDSQNMKKKV